MKILGILIIACLGFYAMKKEKNTNVKLNPKGMKAAMDNAQNKQGYAVGNALDFEQSIQRFRYLSIEELNNVIETETLNLYQVSNALLVLSNHYLQATREAEGIAILKRLVDDYHNPMAMVTLARINFHGFEEAPGGTATRIIKDLGKAYYLINRGIETAGVLEKRTGQKYALDRCVANGLGLLDSYQLAKVKASFNYEDHQEKIATQIKKDLEAFVDMYNL